jgi:hypothetical protein
MTFWRRACLSSMYNPKLRADACSTNRFPKIDEHINWATRQLSVAIGNNGVELGTPPAM